MTLLASENVINPLFGFVDESVFAYPKIRARQYVGYAKIGIGLSAEWTIYLPSRHNDIPDIPLVIPGDAQSPAYIYYIGIRTCQSDILGTAGEKLKIADAQSNAGFISPAVDGDGKMLISPDDARPSTEFATCQLPGADTTLVAPFGPMPGWSPRLFNVAAGGATQGTGMKSADPKKDAIVVVDICFLTADERVANKEAMLYADW